MLKKSCASSRAYRLESSNPCLAHCCPIRNSCLRNSVWLGASRSACKRRDLGLYSSVKARTFPIPGRTMVAWCVVYQSREKKTTESFCHLTTKRTHTQNESRTRHTTPTTHAWHPSCADPIRFQIRFWTRARSFPRTRSKAVFHTPEVRRCT